MKRFAEINGQEWEAGYPFCAGCPELVIGGGCAYEGNGCRFPDTRMENPRTFYSAYHTLRLRFKVKDADVRGWEKEAFESKKKE